MTFCCCWGASPGTVILPSSASWGMIRGSGSGDVRASPHVQRTQSVGSPSSTPGVAGYE